MNQIREIANAVARRCTCAQWKKTYRAYRVSRREARKAWQDAILLGRGFIEVPASGDPVHLSALALLGTTVRA